MHSTLSSSAIAEYAQKWVMTSGQKDRKGDFLWKLEERKRESFWGVVWGCVYILFEWLKLQSAFGTLLGQKTYQGVGHFGASD